jgi:anti-anti-sigma factor
VAVRRPVILEGTPMEDSHISPGDPQVSYQVSDTYATVRIGGPLVFPGAVAVSRAVKQVIEQQPPLVLLDLTGIENVDATGVAVLVGVGGDLKSAGIQVRVIAADPRIRHRLPYTLGLRKVFPTIEDALCHQP